MSEDNSSRDSWEVRLGGDTHHMPVQKAKNSGEPLLNGLWDDDWSQRLREGAADREIAISELRSYLHRGLSQALASRYGGHVDPDDIAQKALLKILSSLDSYRGESRFTTWAMAIAVRLGISELRRRHYQGISLDSSAAGEALRVTLEDSGSGSGESDTRRRSLLSLLDELINLKLTDRQRFVIRGVLKGLPVEEIAARLQSNRNAIYKLVHDARMRLRAGFETVGVTAEDIMDILG
jgi:RNA polymerase sigma factor (sigma-70 family)